MVKKMTSSVNWLAILFLCFAVFGMVNGADDFATKCSAEFPKVTMCLPFATSKAATPSKECCNAVTDLRSSDPGCLCYVIQQVHNGSNAAVKSMGVSESRLLQLPSACKMSQVHMTECPKLLQLAPNSPDAAIFTNSSSAAATTTPVATPGGSSSSPVTASSRGIWHKPQTEVSAMVAVMIFFLAALT